MFDDTYRTVKSQSQGAFKEKGSRFLSFVFPVSNEQDIKTYLNELRKTYFDARHNCYAYALGPARDGYRQNDDGEPSGTAGKPIYGQILSNNITNVLIVVVRYFGGTKLGVRGLIDAYKAAAQDALKNNEIIEKIVMEVYEITFAYPHTNNVMKIIKENNLNILQNEFNQLSRVMLSVRKNKADQIKSYLQSLNGLTIDFKYTF